MGMQKHKRPSKLSQAQRRISGDLDGVLSKQVLAGAKRGSLEELMQVSKTLVSSEDNFTAQLLDVILCHFQSNVPTNLDSSANFTNGHVKKCINALMALHLLFICEDAVVASDIKILLRASWRGVFGWMQFFYDTSVANPVEIQKLTGATASVLDMLIGVFLLFLVAQKECQMKFVTQTPGVARLATRLWIEKEFIGDESQGSTVSASNCSKSIIAPSDASRLLFLTVNEERDDKVLDEVVEAARTAAKGLSIPEILRNRTKLALRGGREYIKSVGGFFQLMGRLTVFHPSHSLRLAFVESEMVPFVVKSLGELAAKVSVNDCLDSNLYVAGCVTYGFQFICYMFNTTLGTQWVLQAINAGFLEVFIAWSPMFPFFPAEEREDILSLLRKYFMPFLVYSPVLLAAEVGSQRLRDNIERSTEDAKLAWGLLTRTVSKRAAIGKVAWGGQANKHRFVCDNCCKVDDASTFKRCAGCQGALYCSKACQAKAWKERGHREQCKQLKAQGISLTERSHGVPMYKQVDAILRDIARCEAFENLEELRAMAQEQLPDVHIDDVGVEVEFDVFPPNFRVFARPECVRARQARDQGVDIPTDVRSSCEPRDFAGDKLWRTNKDLTLFIVKIRRGEGCLSHPYGITKFWDGMSGDDVAFDRKLQMELRLAESRQNPDLKEIAVEGGRVFVNRTLAPGIANMFLSASGVRPRASASKMKE
ncbi:hypothetical protein SCHPADRAFT_910047 [Schizopora paradoxa]|uniref:MYND-type domain-containing protein n=1 Tax=Schizopora paradoxa TaxID=27342 RepID=A0A0H2R4Q3_9AGAM|nr:hypothetical protein SCHPADRAFT_910047 [Schizopora paradoxa]